MIACCPVWDDAFTSSLLPDHGSLRTEYDWSAYLPCKAALRENSKHGSVFSRIAVVSENSNLQEFTIQAPCHANTRNTGVGDNTRSLRAISMRDVGVPCYWPFDLSI
jgi:hypothetical protein